MRVKSEEYDDVKIKFDALTKQVAKKGAVARAEAEEEEKARNERWKGGVAMELETPSFIWP